MADVKAVPAARVAVTAQSATELIGNTPLVRLNKIPQSLGLECDVYAKVELFNTGGSVKDRIALRMIEEAEKSGRIKPGDTLIEPTSGNTGIGLALVGAIKGYKTIITLPEKMSAEKVSVLKALGATIIRTPTQAAWDAPESHIGVARRLQKEIPNAHILDQYANVDNPLAHELGTAEEIWAQTGGNLTAVVAGAGTGGTITGIARGIRKHSKTVKIIAADPQGSILALPEALNADHANEGYKVEGIGYDFIPDVLEREIVDKWYKTEDRESFQLARRLIAEEGLLGDTVVVVLPDSIRSYLSKFADDDWLAANDLLPEPVMSVVSTGPCAEAIEIMRDKGFDQLPVLSPPEQGGRLVGLVTLGNLLSYLSSGRATGTSPVSAVMFDFGRLDEVVTDPRRFGDQKEAAAGRKKRQFVAITLDTPLSALQRFFEWNSAAVVTEAAAQGEKTLSKPVAVVTKVDLLTWLVSKKL
ncbi:hypothetical protein VdG2_07793 [Verticillium dahliae VDG2]|nr:hypothetical protein VdG2_07793 [Verticillium dahliae VDG2]